MELESSLLRTITKKQVYNTSFSKLVANFETKLLEFNPVQKPLKLIHILRKVDKFQ